MKFIKKNYFVFIVLTITSLLLLSSINAEVPRHIAYQGILRDGNGDLLPGPVDLVIRFYDAETEGNLLFEEEHKKIQLVNGSYSIQIGKGLEPGTETPTNGIPDTLFGVPELWLTESVNGGGELMPRLNIGSSIFALRSKAAEQLVKPDSSEPSVFVSNSGQVGIGTESPTEKLSVAGIIESTEGGIKFPDGTMQNTAASGSGGGGGNRHSLDAADGDPKDAVFVGNDGKVGIGNTLPNYQLDVRAPSRMGFVSAAGSSGEKAAQSILLYDASESNWAGIQVESSGDISLNVGTSTRYQPLVIDAQAGHIGIGTVSPGFPLDINGAGIQRIRVTSTDNQAGIEFVSNNTGRYVVYSPTDTDDLRFHKDGDRVTFTHEGNVGIGTITPTAKLDVQGTVKATTFIGDGSQLTGITPGSGDGHSLDGAGGTPEDAVFVDDEGKVGVGTSEPAYKLDISGTDRVFHIKSTGLLPASTANAPFIEAGPNEVTLFLGSSGSVNSYIADQSSGNIRFNGSAVAWGDFGYYPKGGGNGDFGHFRFSRAGSDIVRDPNAKVGVGSLYSAGNIGIGITSPSFPLDINGAGIQRIRVTSTDNQAGIEFVSNNIGRYVIYSPTDTDDLRFHKDGDRVTITGDGKVGIGTTSPSVPLHVVGPPGNNSAINLTTSNPELDSRLLLMAVSSNNRTESQIQFNGQFHLVSPIAGQANLSILENGNVGIGRSNPVYSLHVNDEMPVLALQDADDKDGRQTGYVSLRDMEGSEQGWFGFGSEGNEHLGIFNNHSAGAIEFATQGQQRMLISENGNVGIGGENPLFTLDIRGSVRFNLPPSGDFTDFRVNKANGSLGIMVDNNGWLGIGKSPAAELDVNGAVCSTVGCISSSDLRWKKEVKTIDEGLEKITELRGVEYQWKKDKFPDKNFEEGNQIGFIAQDVEKIIPELVRTDADGYKSMDYARMTAVLVEAVKELNSKHVEEIAELRAENEELKTKVKNFETLSGRIAALEEQISFNP